MILAWYAGKGCIDCGTLKGNFDCGHFRRRECMPTRYHPWNLAKQNRRCKRYDGGRTFEFGAAIDRQYGRGTAAFLERLSRKIEPWTTEELGTLRAAARWACGHSSRRTSCSVRITVWCAKWRDL